MGKREGKRQFARSRHRFEDNIVMDREKIGWHALEWIYRSQKMPSGGLPFQILSIPHIMRTVQFDLR
jgi:hypothetical protein